MTKVLPFSKPENKPSLSALAAKARAGDRKAMVEYFRIKKERMKKRKKAKRPTANSSVTAAVKFAAEQDKKMCETLWPIYIKLRDRYQCQLRGKDSVKCSGKKRSVMQAAHIVTRGVPGIKFHPLNGVCLCSGHHVYYTYHPGEWEVICKMYFPAPWQLMWRKKWKISKPEWSRWLQEIRNGIDGGVFQ